MAHMRFSGCRNSPPTMMTSWCESGMTNHHTGTFCSFGASSQPVHDRGHGGRRLTTQGTRRASCGDSVSAGLCALLLNAANTAIAIASSSATRWKQQRQEKQIRAKKPAM